MAMPQKPKGAHRPRELRRRVMVRARMRNAAAWSDACILNVSSRGLLIHAARQAPPGTQIELWHGEHVIVAVVVWREGAKAGLRAANPVPVEQIASLGELQGLRLTTGSDGGERRKHPRPGDKHRWRGKALEFAGVVAIGASLASGAVLLVEEAFARPLALVQQALGPPDQLSTDSR